jgi:hypothetical protein
MNSQTTNQENSMNAESDLDQDRHNLARPSSTSIAIIGVALALFGYAVVSGARHPVIPEPAPVPSQVTNVVAAGNAAVEATATAVKEQKGFAALSEAQGGPRECEPAKGITSNCIFE